MIIDVVGIPLFYGCDKPGVENGPDTLRAKGVIDIISRYHHVYDLGNVNVRSVDPKNKYQDHPKMKYLQPILETNIELATTLLHSLEDGHFPLSIGGDHALGIGSLAATGTFDEDTVFIWVDAHTDINTDETTETGNIHGMPVASGLGFGHPAFIDILKSGKHLKASNLIYIGVRSIDPPEQEIIDDLGITYFTTKDIKQQSVEAIMLKVLDIIKEKDPKHVHLSFDIDVLDKKLVPGTGTAVDDGINLKEGNFILKSLAQSQWITSMDFVEFNPDKDEDNRTRDICLEYLEVFFKNLIF